MGQNGPSCAIKKLLRHPNTTQPIYLLTTSLNQLTRELSIISKSQGLIYTLQQQLTVL